MIDFIKDKKLVICAIFIMIIGVGMYIYKSNSDPITIEDNRESIEMQETEDKNEKTAENVIIVHVAGAVKKPGIVKLKEGSRVEDAVNEAGGLEDNADISNINLAYILEDGIKIKIPTLDEKELSDNSYIIEDIGDKVENSKSKKDKININTASESELETLEGIGASLAEKIVEYREKNGKFKNIEDIKNVTGIGDSKFEVIKNKINV